MTNRYLVTDPWSIIEDQYNSEHNKSSESLFSIGNGAMGQRANFEEDYSGPTFQGSYIGGIYYPDKTRVGWWKNGYPEYFAKVLNAPNWIGIHIKLNNETLDLNKVKTIFNFKRELNMKEGILNRSFSVELNNGIKAEVNSSRFVSLEHDEVGLIKYSIKILNGSCTVDLQPYIDAKVENQDSNWDDAFWNINDATVNGDFACIESNTNKTKFHVATAMINHVVHNGEKVNQSSIIQKKDKIINQFEIEAEAGDTITLTKYAGYFTSFNHDKKDISKIAENKLREINNLGYAHLDQMQKDSWSKIWDMSDIEIEGDELAQQGIRFNIFQLNQTYSGKDARLNIGPKGFTGEKYGGSTYWDTEAYCLPFYMSTKTPEVAENLLKYRYQHLEKAIENAAKLNFNSGAALYPMVTMNGEECHNEWEITFEEIHRNGAIAFAIFNYSRYMGNEDYLLNYGIEVLIGIARFWKQRVNFSKPKNKYVILGVTGPNEYENNVNNNFYTNYIAKWCIEYTLETFNKMSKKAQGILISKLHIKAGELDKMKLIAEEMFFPYSEEHQVFLQQDNFLDKEIISADLLKKEFRPINQNWSWDRILRSCYIKQADVLQCFYFFEDQFTAAELEKNFNFYEPLTVHESSLSPCVHAIQAARLNKMDMAYDFYLQTSRLDLDDYNNEVEEGCHITSMAGTWLSIVEGFAGMRIKDGKLTFAPKIPKQWKSYNFKINYRNNKIKLIIDKNTAEIVLESGPGFSCKINDHTIELNKTQTNQKINL